MSVDVVMPQMGESITEGTVSKWLKKVGERVGKDEPVLEISTDKVDAEVPSPGAGVLLAINTQEGETVEVGSVLAVIGEESEVGNAGIPARQDAPASSPNVDVQRNDPDPRDAEGTGAAGMDARVPADSRSVMATQLSGDATKVVMPQMGESITEGTVSKWLKAVGDKIEKDEALLEISTDKVDAEVPSPAAGTLLVINVPEGETVEVGSVLASIGAEGAAPAAASQPAKPAPPPAPAVAE